MVFKLQMNYIEIKVELSEAKPWKEIFITFLSELGCDSFADGETDEEFLAYIPKDLFNEELLKETLSEHDFDVQVKYQWSEIPTQNWNQIWESNYSPVLIADRCFIRAPFHEPMEGVEYEIVIEPKMSFGTAHHETTSLMVQHILKEELAGKSVLDMGAGTGILAILAYLKGARPVTAIDNDEWAYLNNIENNERNHTEEITVKWGDAQTIEGDSYEVIFANINRNILLNDLPHYVATLQPGGSIFLSGFYVGEDLAKIQEKCNQLGLRYVSHLELNQWCAAHFINDKNDKKE